METRTHDVSVPEGERFLFEVGRALHGCQKEAGERLDPTSGPVTKQTTPALGAGDREHRRPDGKVEVALARLLAPEGLGDEPTHRDRAGQLLGALTTVGNDDDLPVRSSRAHRHLLALAVAGSSPVGQQGLAVDGS